MTEQTPTDQEIDSLVKAEMQAYFDGEYMDHGTVKERLNDFARAVLAKFGNQPAGAGEPVQWEFRWLNPAGDNVAPSELAWKPVNSKGMQSEQEVLADLSAYRYKGAPIYEVRPLFTTPQPTQAQAGAVPP